MKKTLLLPSAFFLILAIFSAQGAYRNEVGWNRLIEEYGDEAPNGAGVKVSMIESLALGNYQPNSSNFDFSGKTFSMMSGDSGASNHATVVGQRFFGNSMSMSGGIDTIDVYEAIDWLYDGFLQTNSAHPPKTETSRIQNHSWVGSFNTHDYNVEAMRRFDYAIERDGFLAIVALRNDESAVPPLLAHSYNALTVGRPNGNHSRGGTWFDQAGRTRPDLVAPGGFFTSYSVPVVSSAAAILLEEADRTTGLANAAAFPQAIKAILMAGATKTPFAEWSRTEDQPLDPVFGAGQLDVYNSYRILTGGEHVPQDGSPPAAGWRIGRLNPGEEDIISFSFEDDQETFTAHLAWNRKISVNDNDFADSAVMLGHFELTLHAIEESQSDTTIQSSNDSLNNNQHLFVKNLPAGEYALKVSRVDSESFEIDHVLAWDAIAVQHPPPTTFSEWCELHFTETELQDPDVSGPNADPDGDGIPNLVEYALLGNPRSAGRTVLPVHGTQRVEEAEYLTLTFIRSANREDIEYRVDVSSDFVSWTKGAGVALHAEDNGDGTVTHTYRTPNPVGDNRKNFLRLSVSLADSGTSSTADP